MSARVKSFRAPDVRSALAQVRAELGPDAVILGTREVPGGLLRRAEVEITAGLPAPAERRAPPIHLTTSTRGREPERIRTVVPAPRVPGFFQPPAGVEPPPPDPVDELVTLRRELEQLRRRAPQVDPRVARLVAEGFGEASARALLAAGGPLRAALAAKLSTAPAPWSVGRARVLALVGPTGVGKTTTLAKIAARALMESRRKVALVTVDTYRIGACEQVARYGEIMGVPTQVARDRGELNRALERFASADLVLIDTAGRSLSEAVARQAELVRTVRGIELCLVASAATGARELGAVAARYATLSPEAWIFTKLDESCAPAQLTAALSALPVPVCCVADGQRVPEDVHAVTAASLAERLLPPAAEATLRGSAGGAR